MKKINILIILASIVLIIFLYLSIVIDVKIYPYEFNIGDHVGFNVDNDKFYFGTLMQGSQSSRFLTIKDPKHDIKVIIKAYGDLSNKLIVSDNKFKLKKGEEKAIKISLLTNETLPQGKYQGNIIFISTRF